GACPCGEVSGRDRAPAHPRLRVRLPRVEGTPTAAHRGVATRVSFRLPTTSPCARSTRADEQPGPTLPGTRARAAVQRTTRPKAPRRGTSLAGRLRRGGPLCPSKPVTSRRGLSFCACLSRFACSWLRRTT